MIKVAELSPREKIIDPGLLANPIAPLKSDGWTIALCHGIFDLLYLGHIRRFERAKSLENVLVVPVTPDIYVNKGPYRPAFSERLRAEVIARLLVVDYVAVSIADPMPSKRRFVRSRTTTLRDLTTASDQPMSRAA